jgi:Tol biopolymer transport system component
MQSKAQIILLLIILFGLFLAVGYWWTIPRLLEVSPHDGAVNTSASTPLRLVFSRAMQKDSVVEHLEIEPPVPGSFTWEGNNLIFTPNETWPVGGIVTVRLKAGARASGLLSWPMRQAANWTFTISQPRLAYLYPANLPAQVYLLDVETGDSAPITDIPGGVHDFKVSTNGVSIYFSAQNTEQGSSIYRLDLSSQFREVVFGNDTPTATPYRPIPILECPLASCQVLAISPKGDYLAFERAVYSGSGQSVYSQVWIAPLPETGTANLPIPEDALVLVGDLNHQTLMPAWSAEGMLVFYDVNAAEFVFFDPKKGVRARFPNQTGQPGAWHPNGRYFLAPEIFFPDTGLSDTPSATEPLANSHLILYDWQSGATQELTTGQGIEDAAPAYSPDGALLAFARKFLDSNRWTPGRQIWLMETENGEARPLTDAPLFNHFDFAWSYDPAAGDMDGRSLYR